MPCIDFKCHTLYKMIRSLQQNDTFILIIRLRFAAGASYFDDLRLSNLGFWKKKTLIEKPVAVIANMPSSAAIIAQCPKGILHQRAISPWYQRSRLYMTVNTSYRVHLRGATALSFPWAPHLWPVAPLELKRRSSTQTGWIYRRALTFTIYSHLRLFYNLQLQLHQNGGEKGCPSRLVSL